jgi:hypothetical protein
LSNDRLSVIHGGMEECTPVIEARTLIRDLGGASVVSKDLGVGRSAVSMWASAGIPAKYWPAIIRLASAKGLPSVTLESLERHKAPHRPSTATAPLSGEAA